MQHISAPPVFILGADRSGTTLLRLYLTNHPKLGIPPESKFLSPLLTGFLPKHELTPGEVESALRLITASSRWPDWRTTEQEFREAVGRRHPVTISELVSLLYQLEVGRDAKSTWGDKTPAYIDVFEKLYEHFPSARFIGIHRDGRDVYLSLKRVGWRGRTAWQIARYWRHTAQRLAAAKRLIPAGQFIMIPYEELVLETEQTLRRVCRFLDMDFHESMLSAHRRVEYHVAAHELEKGYHVKLRRPPTPEDVAKWRQTRRRSTLLFEACSRNELTELGYVTELAPLAALALIPLAFLEYVVVGGTHRLTRAVRGLLPKRRNPKP